MSEGVCPVVGCGHACILGPRRAKQLAKLAAEEEGEHGTNVAYDAWIAGESPAVGVATRTLSGRILSGPGGGRMPPVPGFGLTARAARASAEEAVVLIDAERSSHDMGKSLLPRSLSDGNRSLSGGGRRFSSGPRRARIAIQNPTTPPAAASAAAGLLELVRGRKDTG